MIKLWFAPRTRSVRVLWLLEELGLPYQLERVTFQPPATRFHVQATPTGKFPTIEDGDVVMAESGAIVEYLLERYGDGRLAPPIGSPERPAFLQWLHYAESTAFPPLGIVVWLSTYRSGESDDPELLADARARAAASFDRLEGELRGREYLLPSGFSAADIMMGFTVVAGRLLGVWGDEHPALGAYTARLTERPAYQKALATE
jgi:glutathione S-transferase